MHTYIDGSVDWLQRRHPTKWPDWVNHLGHPPLPAIRRWVLGQQQKIKVKICSCLLSTVSGFFFLFPCFFFNFGVNSGQSVKGVDQREDVGPGSRGDYEWEEGVGSSRVIRLIFTRCCCCFRGLYTECLLHCSLCQGAERHTCPHTSRCLVCVPEMVYTENRFIE